MTTKLTKENTVKFKADVKKWCDANGSNVSRLCKDLDYNTGYLPAVFSGHGKISDTFWFALEAKTGLKRGDYL